MRWLPCHASFSATVALLVTRTFPVTMSFAVYGFGELHDPVGSRLAERIHGAVFVRSINRHGRGQLMLSCPRSDWPKLIYVPLGIDAAEFAARPPRTFLSPPTLMCVGRLAPEKGQALLLEAIAALNANGHPVRLRLVGDGPDRAWLENRAAELGIASSVEFAGGSIRTNSWRCTPKRISSFCRACRRYSDGSDGSDGHADTVYRPSHHGYPRVDEHGVDGMLFAVADVEDLTQNIRRLLDSPELRERGQKTGACSRGTGLRHGAEHGALRPGVGEVPGAMKDKQISLRRSRRPAPKGAFNFE